MAAAEPCEYTRPSGRRCSLSRHGSTFCVLHDPDPNKPAAAFRQALELRLREGDSRPLAEGIDLSGVHFPAPVDWQGRVFVNRIYFWDAQFHQEAVFDGAQFHQEAVFNGAQFHQRAEFGGAQFHQEAFFGGTQFQGEAGFWGAQFHQEADFWGAQFHQEAAFDGAQFHQRAEFGLTVFSAVTNVSFLGARVGGRLTFQSAQFPTEERFLLVVLLVLPWLVRFSRAPVNPGQGMGQAVLQDLVVEREGEVIFEDVDLSRASFLRTDLTRLHFRDVRWATRRERVWLLSPFAPHRNILLDDQALERGAAEGKPAVAWRRLRRALLLEQPPDRLRTVAELYRQLRINLEASRQEVEAGDFYIGQMEMRRRDPAFPWRYRFLLLGFYRFAALYGESWQRPLTLYFLVGMAFAFVYLLAGFAGIGGNIRYTWGLASPHWGDFAQAAAHALSAGGLLQQNIQLLSPWAPIVRLLNALADLFLLGVAVVALRRRFHR